MDVEKFLDDLRKSEGQIWVESGRLRFRGPRSLFDSSCIALLRSHKREIISFLEGRRSTATPCVSARPTASRPRISILFFASRESRPGGDKYRLLMDAVQRADRGGLEAVWLPERHFHRFGGLYPSPGVLGGAVAAATGNIRIRTGSVVLPINNPIRVAEEWSVVDNLSGGRVDLGFAQGWNARDFLLAPENFEKRLEILFQGIELIDELWQGRHVEQRDGEGRRVRIQLFPSPVQKKLDKWLTCSTGDVERFREAGRRGMNVLTALFFQTEEELREKICAYRQHYDSRECVGHGDGVVTLMLHTFVGRSVREVKNAIRAPFTEYLRDSIDLWRYQMERLDSISEREESRVLEVAFERYFETAGLFGTASDCMRKVDRYSEIGVGEIACLLDFGVEYDAVMSCIDDLVAIDAMLRSRSPVPDGDPHDPVEDPNG